MMDGTKFKFDVGNRVKLRDGIDPGSYGGMAKVGNEGWIEGHRRDRFGLPEVFVRWDPNHWAYNQQPNQWTFQDHFELVVEETSTVSDQDSPEIRALIEAFSTQLAAMAAKQSPAAEGVVETSPDPLSVAEIGPDDSNAKARGYAQLIKEASEALVGSEAFVCIAISRRPDERASQGALHAECIGESLSPESETLLGLQMTRYGSQFHANAATLLIHTFAEERENLERDVRAG